MNRQISFCEEVARGLAGPGYSLTPSGDDFILGTLYTMRVIIPDRESKELAQGIVEVASLMIHRLSEAYLRAAI